jgi:tetratricopeptide (TPR) repeat protein
MNETEGDDYNDEFEAETGETEQPAVGSDLQEKQEPAKDPAPIQHKQQPEPMKEDTPVDSSPTHETQGPTTNPETQESIQQAKKDGRTGELERDGAERRGANFCDQVETDYKLILDEETKASCENDDASDVKINSMCKELVCFCNDSALMLLQRRGATNEADQSHALTLLRTAERIIGTTRIQSLEPLERDALFAITYTNLGCFLQRQGHEQPALRYFKQVMILEQTDPQLHINVCMAYAALENHQKALEHAQKAEDMAIQQTFREQRACVDVAPAGSAASRSKPKKTYKTTYSQISEMGMRPENAQGFFLGLVAGYHIASQHEKLCEPHLAVAKLESCLRKLELQMHLSPENRHPFCGFLREALASARRAERQEKGKSIVREEKAALLVHNNQILSHVQEPKSRIGAVQATRALEKSPYLLCCDEVNEPINSLLANNVRRSWIKGRTPLVPNDPSLMPPLDELPRDELLPAIGNSAFEAPNNNGSSTTNTSQPASSSSQPIPQSSPSSSSSSSSSSSATTVRIRRQRLRPVSAHPRPTGAKLRPTTGRKGPRPASSRRLRPITAVRSSSATYSRRKIKPLAASAVKSTNDPRSAARKTIRMTYEPTLSAAIDGRARVPHLPRSAKGRSRAQQGRARGNSARKRVGARTVKLQSIEKVDNDGKGCQKTKGAGENAVGERGEGGEIAKGREEKGEGQLQSAARAEKGGGAEDVGQEGADKEGEGQEGVGQEGADAGTANNVGDANQTANNVGGANLPEADAGSDDANQTTTAAFEAPTLSEKMLPFNAGGLIKTGLGNKTGLGKGKLGFRKVQRGKFWRPSLTKAQREQEEEEAEEREYQGEAVSSTFYRCLWLRLLMKLFVAYEGARYPEGCAW